MLLCWNCTSLGDYKCAGKNATGTRCDVYRAHIPFILRMVGIDAEDTPKIYLAAPGGGDHALNRQDLSNTATVVWDFLSFPEFKTEYGTD